LKAPKKEKKELDEDELAFKSKQQAGMLYDSDTRDPQTHTQQTPRHSNRQPRLRRAEDHSTPASRASRRAERNEG
jgi:Translation machinery associated TMA7